MILKKYCVYAHIFPNGKSYIGITCADEPEKRWNKGAGYKTQPKMKNAINKYGWDNIRHVILMKGLTEEEAKEKEKELIQEFNSINDGYNTSIGGNNPIGTYFSEEILKKIRLLKCCGGEQTLIYQCLVSAKKDKKSAEYWSAVNEAVYKVWYAPDAKIKQLGVGYEPRCSNEKDDTLEWAFHMQCCFMITSFMESGMFEEEIKKFIRNKANEDYSRLESSEGEWIEMLLKENGYNLKTLKRHKKA